MTLPIDRTSKTALDANLVNGVTSDAPVVKSSNDVVYNTIDELYNYTANLIAGGVLQPYPAFLSRQALINGNYDVAQERKTGTNLANASYVCDMWVTAYTPDGGTMPTNIVVSQQNVNPGDLQGSRFFHRLNVNGPGASLGPNSIYRISQTIENGTRYMCGMGKKFTVSFYAKSDISGKKIGIGATQSYGSGGSPNTGDILAGSTFTITSTWTKYTYTFTTSTLVGKTFGTNNDDSLTLSLVPMWGSTRASQYGTGVAETFVGSGNIDIAQVQLNSGDIALPFQPKSFEYELLDCQRYYFKTFDYSIDPAQNTGSYNGALFYRSKLAGTNYDGCKLNYPVRMRVVPSITYYNPGAANNKWRNLAGTDSGIPSTQVSGETGIFVDNPQVVGDNVGSALALHLSADARI